MKKNWKKEVLTALAFTMLMAVPAQAGQWIPEENGQWKYQKDNGTLAVEEWMEEKDEWYYLDGSGLMTVGWKQIGENWYYFLSNGAMSIRWIQVDGKWYYMNLDGKMVSDTVIRNHVIGSDGAWIETPESVRAEKTELYDVTPSYIWDSIWMNRKVTGTDEKEYENSIIISGESMVEYDLDGEYTSFSCRIVPRSGFSTGGSVTLVIYGDYEEELYRIEGITDSFDSERIDVDITGQHVLGIRCIPDSDSDYDTVIVNWPIIYR